MKIEQEYKPRSIVIEMGAVEIDVGEKLFCFNTILGYSRMMYFEFTLKIDTIDLIKYDVFEHFGVSQELL
jgi:transposase